MNNKLSDFSKHHPLILGTLLLTGAGFLSRIIGFFYRIYLSRLFGEEGMGIYQLIHPISGLAFSLTAAAFQTTISKYVAAQTDAHSSQRSKSYKPMIMGGSISIPLSLLMALVLFFYGDQIAIHYLHEERTAILIKLLAFTLPASAAHACINGYYYGIKKASVPAYSQLLEQGFRVLTVYLLSTICQSLSQTPELWLAVIGLIVGEIAGFICSLIILLVRRCNEKRSKASYTPTSITYKTMLSMILPLTANRVFINTLLSLEAVALPASLRSFGFDNTTALSIYGVLTGMAFPLIFFPNALTSSVSILLLPVISENIALGKTSAVKKSIFQTIQYCSILGFFCMGFFLMLGKTIGIRVFHSELAGYFIGELSFLCPFLYLNSTLSGILQGLGKSTALFLCNSITALLRLCMTWFVVPMIGMKGYLWGLLVSQILLTILYLTILFQKKSCMKQNQVVN